MTDSSPVYGTIQIHPWALRELTGDKIKSKVKQALGKTELFYFVEEDSYGRHSSPYEEYIFFQWAENLNIKKIDDMDEFCGVLRDGHGNPQFLSKADLDKMQAWLDRESFIGEGTVVKIQRGPFRGNHATVQSQSDGCLNLTVKVGSEMIDQVIPMSWVRKIKTSTK